VQNQVLRKTGAKIDTFAYQPIVKLADYRQILGQCDPALGVSKDLTTDSFIFRVSNTWLVQVSIDVISGTSLQSIRRNEIPPST
jgi:hypothetical protein